MWTCVVDEIEKGVVKMKKEKKGGSEWQVW